MGLLLTSTGFVASSRCIADELGKCCRCDHAHVRLEGGRASAAQVYPQALCEALLRGVVEQHQQDASSLIQVPAMRDYHVKPCLSYIGGLGSDLVRQHGGVGKPVGEWPSHRVDPIHEEPGGDDEIGLPTQSGIHILREDTDALICLIACVCC